MGWKYSVHQAVIKAVAERLHYLATGVPDIDATLENADDFYILLPRFLPNPNYLPVASPSPPLSLHSFIYTHIYMSSSNKKEVEEVDEGEEKEEEEASSSRSSNIFRVILFLFLVVTY